MVDSQLLTSFDVLIIDLGALAALSPAEREALRVAVTDQGFGVLLLPRGEPSIDSVQSDLPESRFFLPWKITKASPDHGTADNSTRSTRLQWAEFSSPPEHPVNIASYAIEPNGGENKLVTDSQDRPVVSSMRRGRGQIAVSIVRGTWHWRLENQTETFAKYWSFLLTRLAKRPSSDAPQWALANADTFPLFVNQPVELSYRGAAESPPANRVTGQEQDHSIALSLVQSLVEPRQWEGTFWPRHPGWHRVSTPENGAHLDFFVHETKEWSTLRSSRRQAATRQFVTLRQEPSSEKVASAAIRRDGTNASGALPSFVLFFFCASYLWLERRLSG